MWKKAVPVVAMSSLLLVGCNNEKAVPNNNETPMEEVREGFDRMTTPEVNTPSPTNEQENNFYNNKEGPNNGINGNNNGVDEVQPRVQDEVVPNETIIDPNTGTNQTIKEDIKENEKLK